ncbi:MAG: phosphoribosylanthranilate isomerase [Planctomycetota bacterium]|nr:phosphoribosylanthranilate isomerase [Planctomycetota bacterium]
MSVRVKICGLTRVQDVQAAVAAGAEAVGLNFVPGTPRYLASLENAGNLVRAAGTGILKVGVFAKAEPEAVVQTAARAGLDIVQLHGEETADYGRRLRERLPGTVQLWKVYRVSSLEDRARIDGEDWPCEAVLLDARVDGTLGGTGRTFDWDLLAGWTPPRVLILAGGLHPGNVAEAVRRVRPVWVDTASGVESAPGVKDGAKLRAFVEAARAASR